MNKKTPVYKRRSNRINGAEAFDSMEMQKKIGERIAYYRALKKMSQSNVADEMARRGVRVHWTTINKIENVYHGRSLLSMSLWRVMTLMDVLGVDICELLKGIRK